jgi:hypothetical protein
MGDPGEMPLLSGWARARLVARASGLDDCRATYCRSFLLSRASAGDTANAVMTTAAVVRAEMTRLCRITGWFLLGEPHPLGTLWSALLKFAKGSTHVAT